jgi:hypothetical protein
MYALRSQGEVVHRDRAIPGSASEVTVPPGDLLIECRWPEGSDEIELHLEPGEEREVTVGP